MSSYSSPTNFLIIDPANFIGGAERFCLDFLHYLNAQPEVNVTLATTGLPEYLAQVPQNVIVEQVDLPRLQRNLSAWFDFRRGVSAVRDLIRQTQPALVFSNTVRSHVIAAAAVKKTKTPLIWMLHDFTFPPFLLRRFAAIPAKIICVSQAVKEHVLTATRGRYAEKIEVIPNAVDLQKMETLSRKTAHLPLKKDEYWIGTVGRIEPWKGQAYFLAAAPRVLKLIPNARFFIIGAPMAQDSASVAYFEQLKKTAAAQRILSKVYFTGYVPNVYPLLNKLDIVVHTAIEPEPFGRVVIEGMALGKAVIASPLGGPQEIITDGADGYLVDPTDTTCLASAIAELCQNNVQREKVGERARQTVEQKYTTEKVYGQLLEILKNVT